MAATILAMAWFKLPLLWILATILPASLLLVVLTRPR